MAPLLLEMVWGLVAFAVLHVNAQSCYYPNGDLSTVDAPCSSSGGAPCCPLNWECLSNGLCYNPAPGVNIYGRYTCTDQTWQSSSCPQFCTDGNTDPGDQAVLQCADGSWCCDGDRTSFNCCTKAGTSFFSLPQGNTVTSISSLPTPSSVTSSASSSSQTSTSGATPDSSEMQASAMGGSPASTSSTSAAPSTTSTSAQPSPSSSTSTAATSSGSSTSQLQSTTSVSTFTSASVTTASDGVVSTKIITSIIAASPVAVSTGHSSGPSSHLGLIIGLAVGIPVFHLASAITAFILWKRRKASRGHSYLSPPDDHAFTDKYGHQVGHEAPDGRAPELDSYPVALGKTKSGRHSELEGSGLLHSPAISTGTAPPQYTQQSPRSPGLHSVQEETQEPQELWGGYVPYRPPRTEEPSEQETSGE